MNRSTGLCLIACLLMMVGVGCGLVFSNSTETPLEQTLGALTETRDSFDLTATYYDTLGTAPPSVTLYAECFLGYSTWACGWEKQKEFENEATRFQFEATRAYNNATRQTGSTVTPPGIPNS